MGGHQHVAPGGSDETLTDPEFANRYPSHIPYWRLLWDQGVLTPQIMSHRFKGSGTTDDPYIVEWIPDDPRNPQTAFSYGYKWFWTAMVSFATLAVALASSAYTAPEKEVVADFGCSEEVFILGLSLFVLGFAVGPLLWAPLSEMYGRQKLFLGTYAVLTAFNAGAAASQSIWTLIIMRFFAGAFGSSPLTNAGGVVADIFPASTRGLGLAVFSSAPFLGPALGPVIGGFLGETSGWRWVEGFLAIFSGTLCVVIGCTVPETYAPVLLKRRAQNLAKLTGKIYVSKLEYEQGKKSLKQALRTALTRPWALLFREPIVFLLSIYMAIVYGTLYMLFSAFPIVYQQTRGWDEGIGGLSFLGVGVGIIIGVIYEFPDNTRYQRALKRSGGISNPEARLPPTMVGAIAIPIGMFWFAWTNGPEVHYMVSIVASAPFGFGVVLVFLSVQNYLIDAYTLYAASVLAANTVLRSMFGTIFPLFTLYMYDNLGIHWAASIPAFLALMCVPFPFIFYRYGKKIRLRCKFAKQAELFLREMQSAQERESEDGEREVHEEDKAFECEGIQETHQHNRPEQLDVEADEKI